MWGRRRIARAGVIGGVALASLVGPAATPAKADCLYLDFWLMVEDTHNDGQDDPQYVHQGCVTGTDWRWRLYAPGSLNKDGFPHGAPNGYYLDARIPLPG